MVEGCIPILLLLESAFPATTSTGSCCPTPDMEMQSYSHTLPFQCVPLVLPDCSDCAPWITVKGVKLRSVILPPQS